MGITALVLASGAVAGADLAAQAVAPPLLQPAAAGAAIDPPAYTVPLYKSTVVPLRRPTKRVSVGNPGVADIIVIHSEELYVVGKALGSTNVVAWDDAGRVFASFDIEVTHDVGTLKAKLHQLLPGEKVEVHSAQENLILSGQVSSAARMAAALELAGGFLPDCIRAESDAPSQPVGGAPARGAGGVRLMQDSSCKKGGVVNLMQVGGANQVMLKVTIAEMASSVVKKLDAHVNLLRFGNSGGLAGGAVSGGATFPDALDADGLVHPIFADPATGFGSAGSSGPVSPIGPPVDMFVPNDPTIDNTGLFLSYLSGNLFAQAVLDVSRRKGLAKILSEPTLTTLTGQEAKFLSGGEFPVPVPQGGANAAITIEFKEFGVGLRFLPLVLDSGRINLNLSVSVSELSSDNTVVITNAGSSSAFQIPSLTKRSASSTVELGDGQTIGIAGLINDNMRSFVEKFPGLGDIPVLGLLFRSQQYLSGQSELVIFVTPQLARPITPQQVRLPTDTFVAPSELEFYLLGEIGENAPRKDRPRSAVRLEELPQGRFGHDLGRATATGNP